MPRYTCESMADESYPSQSALNRHFHFQLRQVDLTVKNIPTQSARHGLTARLASEASLITTFVALTPRSDSLLWHMRWLLPAPRVLLIGVKIELIWRVLEGRASSGGAVSASGIHRDQPEKKQWHLPWPMEAPHIGNPTDNCIPWPSGIRYWPSPKSIMEIPA
jgi:hypothetical protein